jgi:alpha-mannosidase
MRAYQVNLTTVSCRWDTHPEMKLSQCPGEHTFHFRIYPHAGDYAEGSVLEEAEKHVVPLEIAQAGAHSGTLPRKQSFLSVEPANLVLSALKRAENGEGWVIRLYNPSPETIMGKIQFAQTPESAVRLSLEEIQEEALLVTGNTVSIEAGPKKIFTLRVVF